MFHLLSCLCRTIPCDRDLHVESGGKMFFLYPTVTTSGPEMTSQVLSVNLLEDVLSPAVSWIKQ